MRRLVCTVITAGAVAAGAGVGAQRGQPLPPPMIKEGVTQKIAEHVYVIPDFDVVLVPNVSIVVGTRGTLVVDTGMGAKNGQAVRRAARRDGCLRCAHQRRRQSRRDGVATRRDAVRQGNSDPWGSPPSANAWCKPPCC